MDRRRLSELIEAVGRNEVEPAEALARLAELPFADLEVAKLDLHRELRSGLPEAIFGAGKTPADLVAICHKMLASHERVLVTRVGPEGAAALCRELPDGELHERARIFTCGAPHPATAGRIAVLAAGTSDLPVAEEVAVCARWFGHEVERFVDIGVAGVHRLFAGLSAIRRADVVIVVAGMDGALPSVVTGLVAAPVVAVPTSVGYGASFEGLAALLTMLNSCSPGAAVVNIDNGYGAAVVAHRIAAAR